MFSAFGMSATTSEYEYRDINHLTAMQDRELGCFAADRTRSPYIIFLKVPAKILQAPLIPFESYFLHDQVLIIKMESRAHATANEEFAQLFNKKLEEMGGLDEKLRKLGTAHFEGHERLKRADKTYLPKRLPKGRSRQWPTLILEVGYSASRQKLTNDVQWWQSESQGDVQIILTVDINQKRREIIFEKWASTGQESIYRTVISKDTSQTSIRATNQDPLIIDFNGLFLRDPDGPIEGDILFRLDDLKKLAASIWEEQFEE
ncbi:hypothetical protein ASPZODRAFT_147233 [Penicilliopsis zonata CBS 506.65]|uniref:Uncharacterized protein n=1 Tax=Penicilliopsis zonata CBS 506.65 TaxID=1073090 RepID=A0A1L9S607_9EURO|nr:hypothetical protein ASPZODRAFT_147233 [Penicilliopsis zonata CBS 506.65]OJJ42597.1 hypothetical protein ASPZODRAFT_147233 [Penicilliopsis zonata CBS 506.65]